MNAHPIKRVATFDVRTVVEALSPAVGEDKARAAAEGALDTLGMARDRLSRDDVLRVLERIAQTRGVVGVCARFARSQLILRWASGDYSRRGTKIATY